MTPRRRAWLDVEGSLEGLPADHLHVQPAQEDPVPERAPGEGPGVTHLEQAGERFARGIERPGPTFGHECHRLGGLGVPVGAPAWEWLARREEGAEERKSTRLNSSHVKISYAVFCLKKT